MISLLKCAALPSVSNIELKWELPAHVSPVLIPEQPPTFISVGERLCLYTLLTGDKVTVHIRAQLQKCILCYVLSVKNEIRKRTISVDNKNISKYHENMPI